MWPNIFPDSVMVHLALADVSKIRESFNLNLFITTFHHLTQGLRRADRVIGRCLDAPALCLR
jgi:hypothetical protein